MDAPALEEFKARRDAALRDAIHSGFPPNESGRCSEAAAAARGHGKWSRPRLRLRAHPEGAEPQFPAFPAAPPPALSTPALPRKPMGAAVRAQGRRLLAVCTALRPRCPAPSAGGGARAVCERGESRSDEDASKKPSSLDRASKKWQQLLTDLEGLFRHMEVMFSLTRVPRVLFLLGGTVMSPREFYELNLESICEGSAEDSLEPASCVRKLFHSLFVADVFSELEDLPVMGTVVMLQGHRSCGDDWFRPKLNYQVPTRGRKLTVNLSCDGGIDISASPYQPLASTSTWEDYVWFQAPVTLKGFQE
ncbi:MAD2L1-binding protein-like isoform X1 [Cuculus canorus]|uniref:MAD2L1-binding protein-like isoform X1 n=1 Tax=Cuculus canorus TaxID=55661 RepID=UPI0023AA6D56|nr:MAD2L1-binding protein-like isoform X1 [Cuculus canorus]